MAVESGAFDLVLKFVVVPISTILVGVLGWVAKKLDSRVSDLEDNSNELEKTLLRDYYDKEELRINVVEPISKDLKETREEVKALTGMINDLHTDMALVRQHLIGKK